MGKRLKAACLGLLALAGGCFSIATSSMSGDDGDAIKLYAGGEPREHVVVSNYGWYLFNFCPMMCGNARKGAWCPWAFFRDDVNETLIQDRLTAYAAEKGYNVEGLHLFNDESVLFTIPGASIPLPIPYLVTYREQQLSGVLVKANDDKSEEDAAAGRKRLTREMKNLLMEIPDGGSTL